MLTLTEFSIFVGIVGWALFGLAILNIVALHKRTNEAEDMLRQALPMLREYEKMLPDGPE